MNVDHPTSVDEHENVVDLVDCYLVHTSSSTPPVLLSTIFDVERNFRRTQPQYPRNAPVRAVKARSAWMALRAVMVL